MSEEQRTEQAPAYRGERTERPEGRREYRPAGERGERPEGRPGGGYRPAGERGEGRPGGDRGGYRGGPGADRGGARRSFRPRRRKQKVSKFDEWGIVDIDYKDVERLKEFLSEHGKILSRRVTGNRAKHQRRLTRSVKRARYMALLPYVGKIEKQRSSYDRGSRGGYDRGGDRGGYRPGGYRPAAQAAPAAEAAPAENTPSES